MLRKVIVGAALMLALSSCNLDDVQAKARDALSKLCAAEPAVYASFQTYAIATGLAQKWQDKAENADSVIKTLCVVKDDDFITALAQVTAQLAAIEQAKQGK